MAGAGLLVVGLIAAAALASGSKRKPKPSSPSPSPSPVDPWSERPPAPTPTPTPAPAPMPSGGFVGPGCDPMETPPAGFVCLATDQGAFYLAPKDPERFNPNLAAEAEAVTAVVSEWMDAQPMEIVLCDGTVRVPYSGQRLSDWLTQLTYWLLYRGLAGSPCPPGAAPEDLVLNPTDPAFSEQTPFRDSWMRLNQSIQNELRRRYVSDVTL